MNITDIMIAKKMALDAIGKNEKREVFIDFSKEKPQADIVFDGTDFARISSYTPTKIQLGDGKFDCLYDGVYSPDYSIELSILVDQPEVLIYGYAPPDPAFAVVYETGSIEIPGMGVCDVSQPGIYVPCIIWDSANKHVAIRLHWNEWVLNKALLPLNPSIDDCGVKTIPATEDMTERIGITEDGYLVTDAVIKANEYTDSQRLGYADNKVLVDITMQPINGVPGYTAYEGTLDRLNLAVGKTYLVKLDDREYRATCMSFGEDGTGLGDPSIEDLPYVGEPLPFLYVEYAEPIEGGSMILANAAIDTMGCSRFSVIEEDIHKIDGKYLPEGGVGYVSSETTMVLPPTVIPTDGLPLVDCTHELIDGAVYEVIFDGKAYTCIAETILGNDDIYRTVIGNRAIALEKYADTGEPFLIFKWGDLGYWAVTTYSDSDIGGKTISTSIVNETVHKIDGKFLPEGGVGYVSGELVVYLDESSIQFEDGAVNVPVEALRDKGFLKYAYENGFMVRVTFDGAVYTRKVTLFGDDMYAVGNLAIVNDSAVDTGENYVIGEPLNCEDPDVPSLVIAYGPYYAPGSGIISEHSVRLEIDERTTHKIDQKFLPECTGVQGDWAQMDETAPDYIKNRTHYAEGEVFNLDIPNVDESDIFEVDENVTLVKVSDKALTKEELLGSKVIIASLVSAEEIEIVITEDLIVDLAFDGTPLLMVGETSILSVYGENALITDTLTIPKGLYFGVSFEANRFIKSLGKETLKKLDEKFIPDSIIEAVNNVALIQESNSNLAWDVLTLENKQAELGAQVAQLESNAVNIDKALSVEGAAADAAAVGRALAEKIDSNQLNTAVNDALTNAKESGEFDGKTPVKGVDYFTNEDKNELVNQVLSALPTWEGGSY